MPAVPCTCPRKDRGGSTTACSRAARGCLAALCVDLVAATPDLSELGKAVVAAGLQGALSTPTLQATIVAPINKVRHRLCSWPPFMLLATYQGLIQV